jgi:hypothetical protein
MDTKQEMILIIAKYCGITDNLDNGLEVFIYKEGIGEMVDELVDLLPKNIVSKPLEELKQILAEKTIKLVTTETDCKENHGLREEIEVLTNSIEAIK